MEDIDSMYGRKLCSFHDLVLEYLGWGTMVVCCCVETKNGFLQSPVYREMGEFMQK